MTPLRKTRLFCFLTVIFFFTATPLTFGQTMPQVLEEGTLEEQFDYLEDRTRIYENFRAIREDMFQKAKRNAIDSLNQAFGEINALKQELEDVRGDKQALEHELEQTREELELAIRERDSLSLLGISMNKAYYNTILWSIIGGLILFLIIGFFMYQRNRAITVARTRDFKDLTAEFEEFRKKSRERLEQKVIEHHNEIKRLKEKL